MPTAPPHRNPARGVWQILRHPAAFALRVLQGFRANRGLLLGGAVAYYTLLSLVPLLILVVIGLSHFIDEKQVLGVLGQYLEFVVPGQAEAIVDELRAFLLHREAAGGFLLVTMLFFSALAFSVLETAMRVIFFHRFRAKRRHYLVSAALPYIFILLLAGGLLVVTIVAGGLESMASRRVVILGIPHSLGALSSGLLYLLGVAGEILLLTSIYLVMPAGRLSFRRALIGGAAAGLLWEIMRHGLVWYYATMTQIRVVYGSLTTAIAVLLSVEIAGLVLLLGAQVIAEYERLARAPLDRATEPPTKAPPLPGRPRTP
jgi:YihY family inner membrane protein